MKNVARIALSMTLLLTLSCGNKSNDAPGTVGGPFNGSPSTGGFAFDSSVPQDQQTLFTLDYNNASRLSLSTPPSNDYKSYFDIQDYSGPSWAAWLNQRIKYVVGETWKWSDHTTYASNHSFYPSVASEAFEPLQQIVTLMENAGSGIYLDGKENSKLYTVNVANQSFPVKTTRVGIVRIGAGLFTAGQVTSKRAEAAVNSLLRISVFIHEARHSDGNGTNAGFPHAVCTSGTYVNRSSCENNTNGPYAIESIILASFYQSCADCDSGDKQALGAAALDAYSRLLDNPQFSDSRPESIQ